MSGKIEIPRYTVNIFFALLSAILWSAAYHFLAKSSTSDLGYHFAAEILKDVGVVVAGLAIVDWLWMLFSGDPVQQHLDRLEKSIEQSVNRSIDGATSRLESKIEGSIEVVAHARHSGIVRIDSDPTSLDAGFPTDSFKTAKHSIDLCGMTLHALFARGDFVSTIEEAVRRGCDVRICIASPSNRAVIENCRPNARPAMPGQSEAVIDALGVLKDSLRGTADGLADRLSIYLLQTGIMSASISRVDQRMLVVPYLRGAFTMDSPAMLLENVGDRPVFATYKKEFDYLLAVAEKAG